jgi:hypothetical protein
MAKNETLRRLRYRDLCNILRHRYGYVLPDDDAGREDLYELLLPVSLGLGHARKMKNAIQVWAPWMSAREAEELIDRVNRTPDYLRKPKAQLLGEKLNLLNHERRAWGIRTIRPVDMAEAQLEEQRKADKRARDERRRRKAGSKPRETYLANSLSRSKPWEAEGISRRTWERRRQKPAVASPRQIKLKIRERTLASRTNAERHQGRASHGSTEDRQGSTEVGHEQSS